MKRDREYISDLFIFHVNEILLEKEKEIERKTLNEVINYFKIEKNFKKIKKEDEKNKLILIMEEDKINNENMILFDKLCLEDKKWIKSFYKYVNTYSAKKLHYINFKENKVSNIMLTNKQTINSIINEFYYIVDIYLLLQNSNIINEYIIKDIYNKIFFISFLILLQSVPHFFIDNKITIMNLLFYIRGIIHVKRKPETHLLAHEYRNGYRYIISTLTSGIYI